MKNWLPAEERVRRWDEVERLVLEGRSASEISVIVGVSKRFVSRVRERRNIPGPKPQRFSDEEVALAHALLADGASYGEVARTLNRDPGTVADRFRGLSRCTSRDGLLNYWMQRRLEDLSFELPVYHKETHHDHGK